jgi:hypothetical protein
MRLLVAFCPTSGEQGNSTEEANQGAQTSALAAKGIDSISRCHECASTPLDPAPRLVCCHLRRVADLDDATSRSAWERATAEWTGVKMPLSWLRQILRRRLPIEDLRYV